jgi:hypothetical protein
MNNVATVENIKDIFEKLEINKIIYVDDEFQLEIEDILYAKNIDEIIQKFFEASSGCVSHIRPFPAGLN